MFIVTLNSFYGSALEGSQPIKIYGPFSSQEQAEEVEDQINNLLEEMGEGEILAQAFKVNTSSKIPQTIEELEVITSFEDEDDDDPVYYT